MQPKFRFIRRLTGSPACASKVPLLNQVILAYIALSLVTSALFLIAPVVSFLSQTPLRHMQAYLGILGAGLVCMDLFTNRVLWRGPYVALLYGICALAVVSSILTVSYGIRDNLYQICWTGIEFALFYSCISRTDRPKFQRYIRRVYTVLLLIWLIACCVSLFQYVFQIGYQYVVQPLSDDKSLARQGFLENRLFGIFNPLSHAVYVSCMLLIAGIYYLIRSRQVWKRVLLALADITLFFHIVLSGSRGPQVVLITCVFAAVFLLARNRITGSAFRRFLAPCISALLVTAVCIPCFMGIKSGLAQIPRLTETLVDGNELFHVEELPEDGNILERQGLEDDFSNDRFKIWSDYLSLSPEIGLLGLSPGNYMPYIQENFPNLFIVEYVRENFPGKFESGTIYHVHNGYLMVLVSTGFLGLGLLLAYLVLATLRVGRYIFRTRSLSKSFVFSLAIVLAGGISALFDKGLFFMNNTPTLLFWMAAGIVMVQSADSLPAKYSEGA